ncbi:MAG: CHASE3 domain-containing protein [Hyphomicrobium zavarzinii]|uniref:CHASE3 domain-containing protein n=1 Tax=Hyphomicrobium zavarzinii TaxID=48292 RepID=UPI001A5F0774|nr:CHASE3 domain-containing protein [Hyphomicrobium zavarzinii]MBL8847732.1 CHASE3 domain-containing protein [Hyphomicrobium zavarzinii]
MTNTVFHVLKNRVPEVAGAALILIFAMTIWLGTRYVNQAHWVRHTLEVETRISEIWSLLQDAEIGQRSFILTGDDAFLTPFLDAKAKLPDKLADLRVLVGDNSDQAKAVASALPLIGKRIEVADQTIELRRNNGFEAALAKVLDRQGLELMTDLRERFRSMRREEQNLLDAREDAADRTIATLLVAIALGLFATLGALAAWIVNTRRSAAEIANANQLLKASIAEREAAELQIRQMQKVEAIGQLTGGIAHDFNNMLAVIVSGVGLAQKRLAKGEAGAEAFLAGALDGANRAATLVKRLLAFSRQQPLAPKPIDANKFVAGISELISRAIGEAISMETILGGGLWLTHADPVQLESSLLNLCVNARDAMPEGGKLTVETANCHLDDRYSRLHPGVPAGQYVLIAVTDTGTGMSPEVMAKAFDPFFTTKEQSKGTGLGLSQVYGFVKQTGGHVKVYSEIGQGTTIKIYLPRYYAGEAERATEETSGERQIGGTETILLVEDDARVLELTAAGLRELGYTVLEARNASEALVQIGNGKSVDLLLTDIVMPEMNGRKLADRALELRPDLKVMFMTGFTKNAVVHNGVLDAGVHFLAKPFTLEELSKKIREALETLRT